MIVLLFICILLLLCSFYFSSAETAFLSFNKTKIKAKAEDGNKKAARVLKIADEYDHLIQTILVGNNIVNIALATISTVMFTHWLQAYTNESVISVVSTAVVTVFVLLFGEITPKTLAKDFPDAFVLATCYSMQFLIWVLFPITAVFGGWRKLLTKMFGPKDSDKLSQEELLLMVDEITESGSIDEEEGDLLHNAIEFKELTAEDILTHRVDIEAIPDDATKEEIAKVFSESKFSRLPVYHETIDSVVGVIHQKDFYTGGGITGKKIAEIMTAPIFVPRSEKIDDLLRQLQSAKSHVAVVLDEYGGTYGLVTMEDILEELVGEIWDEHDEVIETFREVAEDKFIVDGSVALDEFSARFEVEVPEETESLTLGGLVTELLGKIPEEKDECSFENLNLSVGKVDNHRVTEVEVTVLPKPNEEEDEDEKPKEKDGEKDEEA